MMASRSYGCPPTTSSYQHCGGQQGTGSDAPCRDMYNTALGEKQAIHNLNDRLANYLNKLRSLQSEPQIDPAKYRDAMLMLENEMNQLRNGYESELDRLRRALEDCCREKNNLSLNANKYGSDLSGLQGKVSELHNQLQKALADNQTLCSQMAGKDKEIADLRACLNACQLELENMRPEYNRLKKDAEDCRRRLECELKAKADDGCHMKQMMDKCNFDNSNKDKQIQDLQGRLKGANDIIISLESKIKQLSQGDGYDIKAMLQKARDETAAQLGRQQQATEDALNKSLQSLKCQLDTDAADKGALQQEINRLVALNNQMRGKVSDLEGQLTACCSENTQLKAELDRQRVCSEQEIKNLEQKLRELHMQMMSKMQECNKARDQQLSLHAEIGNYQTLLDAVGSKVNQSVSGMTQPNKTLPQICPPPVCSPPSYSAVRRPVTAAVTVKPPAYNPRHGMCRPMTAADVLGSSLNMQGSSCCDSCSGGGVCDSKTPAAHGYNRSFTSRSTYSHNTRPW